jgi:sugar phosphate permease
MAVGVPGLVCALLAARLVDPTRAHPPVRLSPLVLRRGLQHFVLQFHPILLGTALGGVAAVALHLRFGAGSDADMAALGAGVGAGVLLQIVYWVRAVRHSHPERTPLGDDVDDALAELSEAVRRVLGTPTLVYVFLAGALISFGMNGIVGWGPTFVSRELGLDAAAAAKLLGGAGLVAGVAGTLAGGAIADTWYRRDGRARVFTVAIGLVAGSALTLWVLTLREPALFRVAFVVAFFFLSWNFGPLGAVIFDVVPARIGATVAGAYYLFSHLAGDAIAMPLVGFLSDRFGLERAVFLLPLISLLGGALMFLAAPTVRRDMARVAGPGGAP